MIYYYLLRWVNKGGGNISVFKDQIFSRAEVPPEKSVLFDVMMFEVKSQQLPPLDMRVVTRVWFVWEEC